MSAEITAEELAKYTDGILDISFLEKGSRLIGGISEVSFVDHCLRVELSWAKKIDNKGNSRDLILSHCIFNLGKYYARALDSSMGSLLTLYHERTTIRVVLVPKDELKETIHPY